MCYNLYVNKEEEENIVYLFLYVRITLFIESLLLCLVSFYTKSSPKSQNKKGPVTEILDSYYFSKEPFDDAEVGLEVEEEDLKQLL